MKPSDLGFSAERFPSFRSYPGFDQLDTALKLATGEPRWEILNAPTGTGKSLLSSATGKLRQARYLYLVGTRGLQSQLLGDGLVERLVYGHRNYPCAAKLQVSDADADDPEFRCAVPRDRCQHTGDVEAAKVAGSVVTNYAYWLSIGRYSDPDLLGEFDFLVCDECHGAASWLTKAVSIYISSGRLKALLGLQHWSQIPKWPLIGEWREWAQEIRNKSLDRRDTLDSKDPRRRKLDRLVSDLVMLTRATKQETPAGKEPWIVIPSEEGGSVTFSPRWGKDFAEQYLFRGIPKILLTSATITPQHAGYLGVPIEDPKQCRYTEVPSPFDLRKRPVVWVPTTRVDYRMSDGAKYKLGKRVDQIIEAAIAQGAGNGVLHTGSYERTREIVRGSRFAAAIITHKQDPKKVGGMLGELLFEEALEKFKAAGREGRFAVMASPRMVEGVDLPGDIARWQIIIKSPVGDTRDPLTKARAEDSRYRDVVLSEVMMQMCGRPVRGNEDYATTFILDDHWSHYRSQCPFPGWFRAAFQVASKGADGEWEIRFLSREIVEGLGPMEPVRQVEMLS